MRRSIIALVAAPLGALGAALSAAPATAAKRMPPPPTSLAKPISGMFADDTGGIGSIAGITTLRRFTSAAGQLQVVGTVTATLIDSTDTLLGTATESVTAAVTATGSRESLHVVVEPVDLDLLGRPVHLDKVVLDIAAQSGRADLLAAAADLLDAGSVGPALTELLDRLLDLP